MPQPGTLIESKYEILAKIRDGGMGTIYKVRHRLLDEVRVVKVLKPHLVEDEDLKRRFVEEARTATKLKHTNIATIHDFAVDEQGTAYLVMEYIEGVNLAEMLHSRGVAGIPLTLDIAHQTLLALAYLHRKGIVHRDVAPDNLMLTGDDEGRPLVKLIDLGIAKSVDKQADLTSTGIFLGKLKYASPEQFGSLPPGEKIDGRSDLYGLGIVLYELLTGVRPFSGETAAELLRAHLFQPPLPFSETDPDEKVPADLRSLIFRALEKKREDRFSNAEEFAREILTLRQRFEKTFGPRDTAELLRPGHPRFGRAAIPATPSAQGRLDRQFAPYPTPPPTSPGSGPSARPDDADGTLAATRAATRAARGAGAAVTPFSRSSRRWPLWVAAAGVAAVAALVFLLQNREPTSLTRPEADAGIARSEPTALSLLPTSAAPTEAAPLETAEPAVTAPPPPATAGREEMAQGRPEAEREAARAARSRVEAQRRRASELAPDDFRRARARERDGETLFERGDYESAQAAFNSSARLFDRARQSADLARQSAAAAAVPSPAPSLPTALPTARPEPTRIAAVLPPATALPAATPTAAPVPAAARAATAEQDKIRETMKRYERAQSTLDADLYSRVFPSADRARIQTAFDNFRSQSVEFEVRRIEIGPSGLTATVQGYERRVAAPRAGTEQRINAERTVTLEKQGDAWVITRLN